MRRCCSPPWWPRPPGCRRGCVARWRVAWRPKRWQVAENACGVPWPRGWAVDNFVAPSRGLFWDIVATKKKTKTPPSAKPPAKPQARSSLFVGSTEKAFQVLEAFNGPHRHMSMAEIARNAELDRSATQRLVYTLEKLGYLRRIPDSLRYGLSSKVLRLSYHYLRSSDLIERASPYLLDISRSLGETANLHELDGHEVVFLA